MNDDPHFQQGSPVYIEDGAEEIMIPAAEHRPQGYWYKIGGGSLTVSVMIHALFAIVAIFLIWWNTTLPAVPPPNEFLPGGGGGGDGNKTALHKRRSVAFAQPSMKMVAKTGDFTVPNVATALSQLPVLAVLQMGGGGFGPGEGDGAGGGIGTGFGNGLGDGWGP